MIRYASKKVKNLKHIAKIWVDMRPLNLRRHLTTTTFRRCRTEAGEFCYSNTRRRVNNEGRLLSI